MVDEKSQRAAVVAEARSWLGTPYAHAQALKRAGVDCGMLIVRCFVDAGAVEPFDPRPYSRTWFLHRDEEQYLAHILKRGGEIEGPPGPGDIVMWRIGRLYAHGAIVSEWPRVIHAYAPARMVIESDVSLAGVMNDEAVHPRRYFSVWA
jgi:cell wall-associated NlpC family hydrolase